MILHHFEVEDVSLVESLQPGRYYLVAVVDGFLLKVQTIVEADDSQRRSTPAGSQASQTSQSLDVATVDPTLSELVTRGLANVLGEYGN